MGNTTKYFPTAIAMWHLYNYNIIIAFAWDPEIATIQRLDMLIIIFIWPESSDTSRAVHTKR